jgi:CRISPR-associated endoribonuclease Cas6
MVELDYLPFKVEACTMSSAEHPLADQYSYQEMAGQAFFNPASPSRELAFNFASPVYFATSLHPGQKNDAPHSSELPYPAVEYVIGSLLERWNTFAPMAFPAEVRRYAVESLVVRRFALRSRTVNVAGGVHTGSVGQISFRSLNYDRYWMSLLHILARYAFYAGVGAKTTMGLGQ